MPVDDIFPNLSYLVKYINKGDSVSNKPHAVTIDRQLAPKRPVLVNIHLQGVRG